MSPSNVANPFFQYAPELVRRAGLPIIELADLHVDRQIGAGGSGSVFVGTWNSVPVAIKKLINTFNPSDDELAMIVEVRAPVWRVCVRCALI